MSNLKFDDLPKEIQEKMLDHQEAQGNKRDPEVFRKALDMEAGGGGFDWSMTPEGSFFWFDILLESYAREYHAKEMERKLEEELDKVKLMTEYHVIQNPTKYDYRDVENARKVINTTEWLLNHLKEKNG